MAIASFYADIIKSCEQSVCLQILAYT